MSTQRLGWLVPQIEIEAILEAGYAELRTLLPDDTAIEGFLRRVFWNVPDARRVRFRNWLRQRDGQVTIIENWPRLEEEAPCQCVVLSAGENHEFVGGVGDAIEQTIDTPGGLVSAEQWTETIGVLSRGGSPDEVLILHQLAKFFIARRRHALAEIFEINMALGQKDLGFVQQRAPHFVYDRLLTIPVTFLQTNAVDIVPVDVVDVENAPEAAYAAS